ncbi:MAG TPA: hypothetical protein VGH51_22780 [Candidatus Angelobacter sp.]|jgi:hypothetical protein
MAESKRNRSAWAVLLVQSIPPERSHLDKAQVLYEGTLVSDSDRCKVRIVLGPDSRDLIQEHKKNKDEVIRKYIEYWLAQTRWNPLVDQEIEVDIGALHHILENWAS